LGLLVPQSFLFQLKLGLALGGFFFASLRFGLSPLRFLLPFASEFRRLPLGSYLLGFKRKLFQPLSAVV